jgi:hypothetical protein
METEDQHLKGLSHQNRSVLEWISWIGLDDCKNLGRYQKVQEVASIFKYIFIEVLLVVLQDMISVACNKRISVLNFIYKRKEFQPSL